MIPLAPAVGKTIVKSPALELLDAPKLIVATDLLESELLYIKHPLAVIVAVEKVRLAKSAKAVVPEFPGAACPATSVPPPAE
jgi:hypothetical protein